jgi:hypothetical protein
MKHHRSTKDRRFGSNPYEAGDWDVFKVNIPRKDTFACERRDLSVRGAGGRSVRTGRAPESACLPALTQSRRALRLLP